MRLANLAGRAALVLGGGAADVATASGGRFGPGPLEAIEDWAELRRWADTVTEPTGPLVEADLRCPVPNPRQVFAIGLNYRSHAEESGLPVPEVPATFTKFPASLGGPFDDIPLVGPSNDWEVELVVVVGPDAGDGGWSRVAGVCVGQDISDRELQFAAGAQFSLGKSRPGYGPVGPWIVTPDELDDPDDLALGCSVDGEVVQDGRTGELVVPVPRLVDELSAILPLLPGDLVFTGTPAGVGMGRRPPRALAPGQLIESWVEGVGTIRNRCT